MDKRRSEVFRFSLVLKPLAIAFWLVPAEPEHELLADILRILAEQLRAPLFEPHVTVFGTTKAGLRADKILKEIEAQPMRLRTAGIGYSEHFTKTLFVNFEPDTALQDLSDRLQRACESREGEAPAEPLRGPARSAQQELRPPGKAHDTNGSRARSTFDLDPHLSLIYMPLPEPVTKDLASNISLPFAEVRFDILRAVECPLPTETSDDVESWRVIASRKLA